jgi:hypothetical protein
MMRDVHTAMMTATVWTLILAVANTTVMTAMTVMTATTVVDMITEIDMTDMIIETVMIDMMTEEVVVVVDILPDQDKEDLLRGNYKQNLSLFLYSSLSFPACRGTEQERKNTSTIYVGNLPYDFIERDVC